MGKGIIEMQSIYQYTIVLSWRGREGIMDPGMERFRNEGRLIRGEATNLGGAWTLNSDARQLVFAGDDTKCSP